MDLKLQGLGANKKPCSVCFSFSQSVKSLELVYWSLLTSVSCSGKSMLDLQRAMQ